MNITLTGTSVCSGGNHRTISTDKGNFTVNNAVLQEVLADKTIQEIEYEAYVIIKHQYLTRRAAGRTHQQALNDLSGFIVRL